MTAHIAAQIRQYLVESEGGDDGHAVQGSHLDDAHPVLQVQHALLVAVVRHEAHLQKQQQHRINQSHSTEESQVDISSK